MSCCATAIEEVSRFSYEQLPKNFSISDSSLACIANCALEIDVEKMVDASYVKRLRQRLRNE